MKQTNWFDKFSIPGMQKVNLTFSQVCKGNPKIKEFLKIVMIVFRQKRPPCDIRTAAQIRQIVTTQY